MSDAAAEVDGVGIGTQTNYYDTLGLDRGLTTEQLQEQLGDMKLGWSAKARRAGKTGEQARATLELIAQARQALRDDDSRLAYDQRLRREPSAEGESEDLVEWLPRAWNYYFIRDEGAAGVAARKAREQDPDRAMAFVVSAWVSLLQNDLRSAKREADEAFVLDELGDDTADVHHVRGVVFHNNGDYVRALQSFDRALAKAEPVERPEILVRKAWSLERQEDYRAMHDNCLEALSSGVQIPALLQRNLVTTYCRCIERGMAGDAPHVQLAGLQASMAEINRPNIAEELRRPVLEYLRAAEERARLAQQIQDERRVSQPDAAPAAHQVKILGAAGFSLVLIGASKFFIIVVLALLAWAGYNVYRNLQWKEAKAAYERAQESIGQLNQRILKMQPEIDLRVGQAPALMLTAGTAQN